MKETRYENYRVTVNVDLWLCSGANAHDNALRRCQEVCNAIKRHVDDVESAIVEFDAVEICSLCDYPWELDEAGVPACCDAAIAEHKKATP